MPRRGSESPLRLLDISPDEVAEYPVAVVLRATAVDATLVSQGAVIQAEVPNHVADQWFGLTRMLDVNAVPDATKGGTTADCHHAEQS